MTPHQLDALRRLLGDPARVSTHPGVRAQHGRDLTYHPPALPDAVVYPETTDEVAAVLRFCHREGIPVVPYGAGTSLEGHVIPVRGGVTLDLSRMDAVLEVRPDDLVCRVQAGVTRSRLNAVLAREGLFFPVDPGADATLGGMAATNASGTRAVRYGAMRQQVLGLEVVLADGTVVRTGGMAPKSSAGYALTALFVGSEGTLGVITELTLRVYPLPEHVVAARVTFPTLEAAARVGVGLVRAGVPVARVELVDAFTVAAVNRYRGTAYPERPTLFLEFAGSPAAVGAELALARELARIEEAESFEEEAEEGRRAELWAARHAAGLAVMAAAPGKRKMVTDVCVPLSVLPEAIRHARRTAEAHGFRAAIFGHAGDGNVHAVFAVDPGDPEEVRRAEAVHEEIVAFALARGGTCTGEHGVGLGKRKYLWREHGAAAGLMRALKRLLDPRDVLNPGKTVPPEDGA